MSDWLPIETAPERQWVLVHGKRARTSSQCMVAMLDAEWGWESADDGYGMYIKPTHWMPLPPPPGDTPSPSQGATG